MRLFTISWHPDKETVITTSDDYHEVADKLIKLDALQDIIGFMTEEYNRVMEEELWSWEEEDDQQVD